MLFLKHGLIIFWNVYEVQQSAMAKFCNEYVFFFNDDKIKIAPAPILN